MPAPSGIGLEKKEQKEEKDDEDEKDYKEEKAYEVVLNSGQLDLSSGSRMSAFRAGLADLASNWTLAFAFRRFGSDRLRCKPSTGGFA